MTHRCPHCAHELPAELIEEVRRSPASDADELEAAVAHVRTDLQARGLQVLPGDLVRENVAAQVLGLAAGTLRNRRHAGDAPAHERRAGRVVYRLRDLVAGSR